MIHSFADRETERLWGSKASRRLPPDSQRRVLDRLSQLKRVRTLEDLGAIPSHRLERLHGDRAGQYSVRVNAQWRICFRWADGAHDVEIVDYH